MVYWCPLRNHRQSVESGGAFVTSEAGGYEAQMMNPLTYTYKPSCTPRIIRDSGTPSLLFEFISVI